LLSLIGRLLFAFSSSRYLQLMRAVKRSAKKPLAPVKTQD
jgi:hypothetical protein